MPTILHISDLHFGSDHFYKPSDNLSLLSVLVKDVRDKVRSEPDCVVISGDLTTQGEKNGLEQAAAFIKDLALELRLGLDDFVIVPGNHEVDWKEVERKKKVRKKPPSEFGLQLMRAGLANYQKLVVNKIYGRARDEFLTTKWSGKGVFVLGLNSCYFEGPDYSGVGYVHPDQLKHATAELQKEWKDCSTRIAVLHHHLVPVTHSSFRPDPDKKSVSITLNAPDILKWMTENGFQVALHGHQHQPFSATETRHSEGSFSVVVLGAGSAGARSDRLGHISKNHYQLIQVGNGRVEVRSRTRDSNAPGSHEDHGDLELSLEAISAALELKVHQIGLRDFFWFNEVPWQKYFEGAAKVEVFALRAGLLFDSQIHLVRQFLRRRGTSLTLIMQDPKDETAMKLLDQHFDEQPGTRRRKIEEVLTEISKLRKELRKERHTHGTIQVRFIRDPLRLKYTYYRFDDTVLFVPYRITGLREPNAIPTFVLGKGSLVENYVGPDSKYLLERTKESG